MAATYGPRVIAAENGFAGLFRLDYDEKLFKKNYRNPVLVACTDGVGSKVLIAREMKRYNTVGIDLVAMSVNDMLVQGAEPLFFLDYLAVHKLEPELIAEMVEGVAAGCRMADCALLGGETAEMPDIYRKGEFDMAGFTVGVVERNRVTTAAPSEGDVISAWPPAASVTAIRCPPHCFKQLRHKFTDVVDELDGNTIGDVLLTPTRIYVPSIVRLLGKYRSRRSSTPWPITGGGLGNIPRVLPKNCNAVIRNQAGPSRRSFNTSRARAPLKKKRCIAFLTWASVTS